jgi:hypothetical protein
MPKLWPELSWSWLCLLYSLERREKMYLFMKG